MAFQGDSIFWVEVEKVVPNPFQPRREFDQNKLQELADSIRMYGVLQPLTVTRKEIQREDGTFYSEYELIAGERRLRASKLAGVAQVPVIIRDGEQSEQEKLELAIIENLQREDLNAVDRAVAFKQLADVFGLSHAQVAQKVGRSREYVSNSIRLLGLPDHMLDSLKHGDMMEGHARTLLMLTDRPEEQEVVYKEVLLKKLSVREVERIVRKIATDKVRKKNPGEFDSNLIDLEKRFTETLGTRVQIQKTDFGGKLTIDYFSTEDLESILKRMKEEGEMSLLSNNDDHEIVSKVSEHTPLDVSYDKLESDKDVQTYSENSVKETIETPQDNQIATESINQNPTFRETSNFIEPKEEVSGFAVSDKNSATSGFPEVKTTPTPFPSPDQMSVPLASERVNGYEAYYANNNQQRPLNESVAVDEPRQENTQNQYPQREVMLSAVPPIEHNFSAMKDDLDNNQKQPEVEKKDTDESGMYSIKNFGI